MKYTETFKRHVCQEYLSGNISKTKLAQKHSIGGGASRITQWLIKFGYEDQSSAYASLNLKDVQELDPAKSQTAVELEKEVKRLKKELEDKSLQAEMYSRMIDIAENELGIDIRKKSNTK